jgi:hypothetical protein
MKKLVLFSFYFILTSAVYSQVVLTYRNNAPLPGDTLKILGIEPFSPGNEGAGQVWDFSGIQYNGENSELSISAKSVKANSGLFDYNTCLHDNGTEYFYKIDENGSEVVGLANKDFSIELTDPILKVKYPLLYGTDFSDEYNGSGLNKNKSSIAISGKYTLVADANGTLILNDRMIKDVLRIKVTDSKIQINPCNIYEINTTTYSWYAPSSRYPLLGLTVRELKNNGGNPEVTKTAFINPEMCTSGILLAGEDKENTGTASLILYPNPFISKLYYNYFLRKQLPVTIELVDMTGKTLLYLAKDELQPEGYHTGELDGIKADLKMGVYYFRFTFGDKVLVSKVVKM